jgi:hypothetical protein
MHQVFQKYLGRHASVNATCDVTDLRQLLDNDLLALDFVAISPELKCWAISFLALYKLRTGAVGNCAHFVSNSSYGVN